jgi:hypothetical protein
MLWRASSLTLDNQATGGNRTVREVGAALINPVRGFNRLVRGEMFRVSETPPDWRPSTVQAALDVGYRHFSTSLPLSDANLDQAFVRFTGVYGNQFDDLDKEPFSAFQFSGTLATKSGNTRALQELRVRGNLAARPLSWGNHQAQLVAFMTYEYLNVPVMDFGAQGFQAGVVTRSASEGTFTFLGEALLRFNPIAAIRSDYFVTAEGRDYDYGIGMGGRLAGSAVWRGKGTAQFGAGYVFLPVVSGFPGQHHLWTLSAEARGYLRDSRFGFGAGFNQLWRRSRYTFNPDVDQDMSEFRVFLSMTVPRWEQPQ